MDLSSHIRAVLEAHPVVLFMKGTPEYPMCGFSERAVLALTATGGEFYTVNVLADPFIRAGLPAYGNLSTFPQLFICGQLIGGCSIVEDLQASGELVRLLRDAVAAGGC